MQGQQERRLYAARDAGARQYGILPPLRKDGTSNQSKRRGRIQPLGRGEPDAQRAHGRAHERATGSASRWACHSQVGVGQQPAYSGMLTTTGHGSAQSGATDGSTFGVVCFLPLRQSRPNFLGMSLESLRPGEVQTPACATPVFRARAAGRATCTRRQGQRVNASGTE